MAIYAYKFVVHRLSVHSPGFLSIFNFSSTSLKS